MTTIDVNKHKLISQSKIMRSVMRVMRADNSNGKNMVFLKGSATGMTSFDNAAIGSYYVMANKLMDVSYRVVKDELGNEHNEVVETSQPSLAQIADYNSLQFNLEAEQNSPKSFWAEPILNIASEELFEVVNQVKMLLAQCNKYIEPERFCVAKPSCFCDFSGILKAVDNTIFRSQLDKDVAIAGAYLFCVYRSYFASKLERKDVSCFDRDVIRFIERVLNKLENTYAEVASLLRHFVSISELNRGDVMSEFCQQAVFVKDCYDAFQPALFQARLELNRRQQFGFADY